MNYFPQNCHSLKYGNTVNVSEQQLWKWVFFTTVSFSPHLHIFLWRYEVRRDDEDFFFYRFWTHQAFLLLNFKSCLTFTAWSEAAGLQQQQVSAAASGKKGEAREVTLLKQTPLLLIIFCHCFSRGVDMGVFTSSVFNRLFLLDSNKCLSLCLQ